MTRDPALEALAILAGRVLTPGEAGQAAAAVLAAGVPGIGQWPLVIGEDYGDAVLMCGALVAQGRLRGQGMVVTDVIAVPCMAWIASASPADQAASLLDHVMRTSHRTLEGSS